jgi:hypothetical protein
MHIEDLITNLECHLFSLHVNQWDFRVVLSLSQQVSNGFGFTEKQSILALRILKKHINSLGVIMKQDFSQSLSNPTYKFPFRVISNSKKMTIVQDDVYNLYGKLIKVEFPYDAKIIELIRKNKENLNHAAWNKESRAWFFSLTENNILFLMNLRDNMEFLIDEELSGYMSSASDFINSAEKYVPMLTLVDNFPKFINVPDNVSECSNKELLPAIFESRKKGILTWDQQISSFLDGGTVNACTKEFLESDPGSRFIADSKQFTINDLQDIVKYLNPCLFVVPGGDELSKLEQAVKFLKDVGFQSHEISVLFRLSKKTGQDFNEFVRNEKLNSPITENTKIIFISGKFPKTIAKSKIKFHSAIHLGFGSAHYTTQGFVQSQENVIFFISHTPQRELNLAFM